MNRSLPAAGKRAAAAALHRLPEEDPERFLLIVDQDDDGIQMDIFFRDNLLHLEEM